MLSDSSAVHLGNKERYGWRPREPNALDKLMEEIREGEIISY